MLNTLDISALVKDYGALILLLVQNIILGWTAVVALRAIRSGSSEHHALLDNDTQLAAKRSTLEFIIQLNNDSSYQGARNVVVGMKKKHIMPESLFDEVTGVKLTDADIKSKAVQKAACIKLLNSFELISIGISSAILDDEMFKKYYYSTVIECNGFLSAFIYKYRELIAANSISQKAVVTHHSVWQEVIELEKRWKAYPLATF